MNALRRAAREGLEPVAAQVLESDGPTGHGEHDGLGRHLSPWVKPRPIRLTSGVSVALSGSNDLASNSRVRPHHLSVVISAPRPLHPGELDTDP